MKSFKSHTIIEKRSHPTLNTKYDSIDILKFYYGSGNADNMFVTFTDVNKVGINPHSRYSTPNGIYSYPLKSVIDYYKVERNMNKLPFAGDANFMTVFQIRTKKGMQLITKYKDSDWKRDYKILLKYDKPRVGENTKEIFDAVKQSYNKKIKYGDKIQFKNIDVGKFIKIFYKEYSSADAKSKTIIKMVNVLVDYYNISSSVVETAINNAKDISDRYDQYLQHKAIGKLWTVTRKLAEDNNYVKGGFGGSRWNTILRKILGYNGFIDDGAWGIIFQSEPLQSVFLDKGDIQIVQTVPNKFHSKEKKEFFGILDDMKYTGMVKRIKLPDGGGFGTSTQKTLHNMKKNKMNIDSLEIISAGWIAISGGKIDDGVYNAEFEIKDITINGGTFNNCRIIGCDIKGGKFKGSCSFTDCIINGVKSVISGSTLTRCYLYNGNLNDCKFFKGSADNCNIYGGEISNLRTEDCFFTDVKANKCVVGGDKSVFDINGGSGMFSNGEFRAGKFIDSKRSKTSYNKGSFSYKSKFFDGLWDCRSDQWDESSKWYDGYIIMDDMNNGMKFQSYISPLAIENARLSFEKLKPYIKNTKIKYNVDLRLTKKDMIDTEYDNKFLVAFNKAQMVK